MLKQHTIMASNKEKQLYESKTLKKAVADAVKGSSYHLKGSNVTQTANTNANKIVITVKK